MKTIISRCWLDGYDSDPPTMELKLSDGSYLKVGWDSDYSHPLVYVAEDVFSEFVSCNSRETGIDLGDLESIVDEVAASTIAHDSNNRSEYWAAYAPE